MLTPLFYRTVARPAGLAPRFNQNRDQFNLATGDAIEAILKSDATESQSAVVRNWRPISELEWNAKALGGYWAPDDLVWSFAQLFELPRISHSQLFPNNFKFEKTKASASYPAVFENTAEAIGKYRRKGSKTPPPPPPLLPSQLGPEGENDNTWGDGYISWGQQNQNEQGRGWRTGEDEPRTWVQVEGHWYKKVE